MLGQSSVKISFQICRLLQATRDDDPEGKHDWVWTKSMEQNCPDVPACFIQPLNPAISTRTPGKPAYLFESRVLVTQAADLFGKTPKQLLRAVPEVKRTVYFPYRSEGKACFVCEDPVGDRTSEDEYAEVTCLRCGERAHLSRKAKPLLEHMGAHVLHDTDMTSQEVCGLCLRHSPTCQIFLKKGRGEGRGFTVDQERSSCINLVQFRYTSAMQCKANSPCTNVPVICPLCGPKKAAIWRYCLDTHFRERHNLLPDHFPIRFEMTPFEKKNMAQKWKERHNRPKKRNMKKKDSPLVLSEAHGSRLATAYVLSFPQR